MPFGEYLRAAVFEPLGMHAELRESAAAGIHGTLDDLLALARELQAPTLVAPETLAEATSVQFPGLGGVLPDVGRFDPNDWGLGVELRDAKQPHWTGRRNSERTFGHFGGSGTFLWVDPEAGHRVRMPDRPRVRQVGARSVAAAVGRRAGGSVNVSVVGAGVMGLAAARAIAQRGHDVTVFEQFDLKHARGSSHGGVAHLPLVVHRGALDPARAARVRALARARAASRARQLLALYGLLDVEQDAAQRIAAFDSTGIAYEELTPAQARERFGVAYDDVERLVFTTDAGISLADAALEAFAAGARAAGAVIREHERVESLDDVPGDRVVVTAGGWAPQLMAQAGLRAGRDADPRDGRLLRGRSDPVDHRRARRPVLRADRAGRRG